LSRLGKGMLKYITWAIIGQLKESVESQRGDF
jgi:hypothetical protein